MVAGCHKGGHCLACYFVTTHELAMLLPNCSTQQLGMISTSSAQDFSEAGYLRPSLALKIPPPPPSYTCTTVCVVYTSHLPHRTLCVLSKVGPSAYRAEMAMQGHRRHKAQETGRWQLGAADKSGGSCDAGAAERRRGRRGTPDASAGGAAGRAPHFPGVHQKLRAQQCPKLRKVNHLDTPFPQTPPWCFATKGSTVSYWRKPERGSNTVDVER